MEGVACGIYYPRAKKSVEGRENDHACDDLMNVTGIYCMG